MSVPAERLPHRWSREEYDKMIAAGVFHPEARLELIEGEIVEMTPQGSLHATAIRLVEETLRDACDGEIDIRVQLPLVLADDSEPEPDIAVVPGSPRDYRDHHPRSALLVVEVADATIAFDRSRKGRIYARNGIPEYWIVDLRNGHLEVLRGPEADGYRERRTLTAAEGLAPLACPHHPVSVAELLP